MYMDYRKFENKKSPETSLNLHIQVYKEQIYLRIYFNHLTQLEIILKAIKKKFKHITINKKKSGTFSQVKDLHIFKYN